MVFYLGAAAGTIGQAIQADTTEQRAIRVRAEEREEDKTNLILDKALDLGTQDYFKRKQNSESKKQAIETFMNALAITPLSIAERFRIAQGGETSVNKVLEDFDTIQAIDGIDFGTFYNVAGEDEYKDLSSSEFLDLFMPSNISYDPSIAKSYLSAQGINIPEGFSAMEEELDLSTSVSGIPKLGELSADVAAMQLAMSKPKDFKYFTSIEAAITGTQQKLNEAQQNLKIATSDEDVTKFTQEVNKHNFDLKTFKDLQPKDTKSKVSFEDLLAGTAQEIELEKEKGENADQNKIKMLEERYTFYTQKNIERKGDSAITTYERMMLKADEIIGAELGKSNPNQSIISSSTQNKIRAINGIRTIAESKKVGDQPISVFSTPTNAQQYVTNAVKQAFQGADFIEYNDFQDIMNYKFTPDIKELENYHTYIGATNEVLKKLNGEIKTFDNDVFLSNATGDLRIQYNLNIRQYIKDFSLIDGEFNLYKKGNAIQPGKTQDELKADAKNGLYKIGTIVPFAFNNQVIPLVWDGSNLISGAEGL